MSPTEEELFKKYNPDLQKKSLANRSQKQEEFDEFVSKLKEYSKSDKPSMQPCFLTQHTTFDCLISDRKC